MSARSTELSRILDSIKGLPVLVVGDVILDRYVWGNVDRISPEAPVPIVDVRRTEDRLGGAGNVARNLVNLGAAVSLCGIVGDDAEAECVFKLLEKDGIERDGIMVQRGRPTCLKTRIMAQRQQMVRIDREDRAPLAAAIQGGFAAMVDAHIDAAKVVVVSDYGKGAVTGPLLTSLAQGRANGRLGLKSRPLVVDPHPANYLLYKGISVAKPNRREAEVASGIMITDRASAFRAAQLLNERWDAEMMVVTLGEDGLAIVPRGATSGIFLETEAQEVFDVSGAGDTVTAVFAAALAAGAGTQVAGDLANIAAGIVVSEVGTVPVSRERLVAAVAAAQDFKKSVP